MSSGSAGRPCLAREAVEPSLDLYAAGCFHGPRREPSRLPSGRAELEGYLRSRRQLTLTGIHELTGEGLAPRLQRQVLFDLAADLPDAWIVDGAVDQLVQLVLGTGLASATQRQIAVEHLIASINDPPMTSLTPMTRST